MMRYSAGTLHSSADSEEDHDHNKNVTSADAAGYSAVMHVLVVLMYRVFQ